MPCKPACVSSCNDTSSRSEQLYYDQVEPVTQRYRTPPVLQELKALAREQGLWNLFLSGEHGSGLSNLEYAPVKEIMGRVLWAPEVFN